MTEKGMKGLELPLNMIVIIIVAVLVLVVIAAFFTQRVVGGQYDVQREQALSEACQKAATVGGCSLGTPYTMRYADPLLGNQVGAPTTLGDICSKKGLVGNECLQRCGCPTTS